jgi:uncharacterized HAD superfamily protein
VRILLDIDGTVCQYDFPHLIKERFGVDITTKEVYTYSIEEVLGVPAHMVNSMFHDAVFLPPVFIPNARETLHRLVKAGHKITVYTNRIRFMMLHELTKWLEDYKIPYNGGITTKLDDYQPHYFDYHVDDSVSKLIETNGTVRVKLLFDQPWNQGCKNILGSLRRVKSWKEIERIIKDEQK